MTMVESIKSRLKNLATKEHSSMQNELILYALERTIYRLSISKYNDKCFISNTDIEMFLLWNKFAYLF